ncbi:MAG: hypothetical protein IPF99_33110 [Deltaproteobacteria bacterium]|nr:hypothetical protein [Deltaproteobacteria bacterium]
MTTGGRVCTADAGCEQGTTAEEESQCGGRYSTCLVHSIARSGAQGSLCTRACVAGMRTEATGACPMGSICTTNWLQLEAGQVENPGCLPFCATDADCDGATAGDASLMRCNTRLGRCSPTPADLSLRPDGALCNPMAIRATGVGQCRGTCFSISAIRPTEGLCGSFINTRTATAGCPDDAMMSPRGPAGDEQGICIFRECEDNAGCAADAFCVFPRGRQRSPTRRGPLLRLPHHPATQRHPHV